MFYGVKDVANLTVRNITTKDIIAYQPHANVSTNTWSADQVEAMAHGSRAIIWNFNKQGILTVEMQVFDLIWMSILAGRDWSVGSVDQWVREELTVSASNTVTLGATPNSGTLGVFMLASDGESNGTQQTAGNPATTENEYSISTNIITLNATTAPENSKVVVYYAKASASTSEQLAITSLDFPSNYFITGDTYITPKTGGALEFFQLIFPNAKPQPGWELTLDATTPTTMSITFDLLPDSDNQIALYTKI